MYLFPRTVRPVMLPQALQDLSLDYVDTLLVHWPAVHPGGAAVGESSDAACNTSSTRCGPPRTVCFCDVVAATTRRSAA